MNLPKDIFNILKEGGEFTVDSVNLELEKLGYPGDLLDENFLQKIMDILVDECGFDVVTHSIN